MELFSLVALWLVSNQVGNFSGVSMLRHNNRGNVVFTDSHAEARKNENINPPVNPLSGDARALINSHYWDPRKAAGDR